MPLEPVHVHVAEGKPTPNGTKVWITRKGRTLLADRNLSGLITGEMVWVQTGL